MKLFGKSSAVADDVADQRKSIHQEWDRQRERAMSPSDMAEIDAIFSRYL